MVKAGDSSNERLDIILLKLPKSLFTDLKYYLTCVLMIVLRALKNF